MSTRVAFIGLGTMGYPMAGHLARAGLTVTVYNRTTNRAQQWLADFPGQQAATPQEAAHDADLVCLCVGNDDDLRQVTLGDRGALQSLKPGAVLVDHTTASAAMARELAQACKDRGSHFIDAPVSGGQQGAENGQLSIMCGGEEAVFERINPVLAHYGKAISLMGPAGSGQLAKMVNQICVAGLVEALAEGVAFAENAGLDAQKVFAVISQGAAGSWQMVNRHQSMLDDHYDHGFAVDWMRKDLDICLAEAVRNGTPLPVTRQVNDFYREIQAMGGGRWDTSSLLRRLLK
ncbi:3-hydroxyisobutyrate dehydrogenase [Alcanivorax hongdengensis A-11-3]|uniref:3-hydroxyisobutyrate dehydrogenase n=1 Tax=Alcanivorax hongdengensis A-11-3 TaxID=1177179 RepID=L0WDF9_9GAMM|nr:NAD(P)-dependent oxidoreductase [Alcanivorax hongdengensis]EKF74813.1 3-hydroxyisobutyrate dehydrogenase [Alcanivorax hongdengensis A-11-3]